MDARRHAKLSVALLLQLSAVLGWFFTGRAVAASTSVDAALSSPGGVVDLQLIQNGQLGFDVSRAGKLVVRVQELNLYVDHVGLGSADEKGCPRVVSVSSGSETRETFARFIPHRTALNHYNAYKIDVEAANGRKWRLELRLFDDGAAYRIRVPLSGRHWIGGDFAAWDFPHEAIAWRKGAGNRSYEDEYKPSRVDAIEGGHRFMMPTTIALPRESGYALLTEANLVGYADLALEAGAGHDFRHVFHDTSGGWEHEGEVVTPWRTVIVAGDLNELVNSDIVAALCPPPFESLQNAAWIRPGRCLWHWLTTGPPRLEVQHEWIDGASQLGWEYYLIDDGWRDWNGGGNAAWLAMRELVQYADKQGVSLWAWVHSQHLRTHEQRVDYFRRAREIGLVGLKIDFPRPADRDWVDWYDETLRDAAEAELLINFHGSVKPTGRERTWPHELTREAIRGREQGKLPASHDTALPFVRFVQGHADYTPTLLVPDALRGSTFAHELAMAIVYSSPLLCMGGGYEEYLASEASDVLKGLPCVWDETIVLPPSRLGKLCVFARRRGEEWFVAAIGGSDRQSFDINCDFLGDGVYACVELADKPDTNAAFERTVGEVSRGEALRLSLNRDGGYVAFLKPRD